MTTASAPTPASLRTVRFGIWFSLLTILFGFGIGGLFGGIEDSLKGGLKSRAEEVLDTAYKGDTAKMQVNLDKSWAYYKRAHLHAGAIGTSSLVCAILLAFMTRPAAWLKACISLAMGIGGLGYSIYWLLAGYRAPAMGSTSAAKDSLEWLAVPTSGMLIIGLLTVTLLAIWEWTAKPRPAS